MSTSVKKESSSQTKTSSSSSSSSNIEIAMTKPGMRYPMESPGSGDYVFYQTLYQENPSSRMALVWCIEHGVFDKDTAGKLQKSYLKAKQEMIKINRHGASSSSSSSSSSGQPRKKKQKVTIQGDIQVDAGLSVTIGEGIGSMTMM